MTQQNLDNRPIEPIAEPRDMAAVMRGFQTPLAARQIAQSVAQTSSLETMEFFFHVADKINNRAINKNRGSMIYSELPRMTLIPIYAWPVPVIRTKNAQFSIGRFNEHGSSLGPTGTIITQRSMLSHESRILLEKWYGHVGGFCLPSLTTDSDSGKAEALLLFEAIMTNTRPASADEPERVAAVDMVIEDLPEFLDKEAPLLLEHAFANGATFRGSGLWPGYPAGRYTLRQRSPEKQFAMEQKGENLIADLKRNVQATISHVMDDEIGVLVITRGERQKAEAHVPGSKARNDRRDEFYLRQFPSFNMDSAVERAAAASRSMVSGLRESTSAAAETQGVVATALLESLAEIKALRQEAAAREAENARRLAVVEAQLAQAGGGQPQA